MKIRRLVAILLALPPWHALAFVSTLQRHVIGTASTIRRSSTEHYAVEKDGVATTATASLDSTMEVDTIEIFQNDIDDDYDDDLTASSKVTGFRKRWHNWLRDSGGLRLLADIATRLIAAPRFFQEYPHCFPDFVRISGSDYSWLVQLLRSWQLISDDQPDVAFTRQSYGPHPLQQAEVLVNHGKGSTLSAEEGPRPIFFFMHGGAWGSGFPTMYRLISVPFLQKGYRVVVLGYRTYPDGKVEEQVDDLAQAVEHFVQEYGGVGEENVPVVLMGHSSGAHISVLAAVKGRIPAVDAIVAAAGVYDCAAQVLHEQKAEIDQLSPLTPVAGMTRRRMKRYSPSLLVSKKEAEDGISSLPSLLLVHGQDDTVVLPSSSSIFFEKLQKQGRSEKVELKLLDNTDHKDPVVHTLVGGQTQSVILEWLEHVL